MSYNYTYDYCFCVKYFIDCFMVDIVSGKSYYGGTIGRRWSTDSHVTNTTQWSEFSRYSACGYSSVFAKSEYLVRSGSHECSGRCATISACIAAIYVATTFTVCPNCVFYFIFVFNICLKFLYRLRLLIWRKFN